MKRDDTVIMSGTIIWEQGDWNMEPVSIISNNNLHLSRAGQCATICGHHKWVLILISDKKKLNVKRENS